MDGRLRAGDRAGALAHGIDGLWLALPIGVPVTVAVIALAHPLARAVGAPADVAGPAAAYLRIGVPMVVRALALRAAHQIAFTLRSFLAFVLDALFTTDHAVRHALVPVLLVAAVWQP